LYRCFHRLFSDTEFGKYHIQKVLDIHPPGNPSNRVSGKTKLLCSDVQAVMSPRQALFDCPKSLPETIDVTAT